MAKSDKKEKKDKKEKRDKRDKKDRKEKKRKRDSSSDDDDQGYRNAERLAEKVTKHLQKGTTQAYADDEGGLHLANRFVWKKKIAKDLQEGATVKEVTAKVKNSGELDRQAEIEKVRQRRAEAEREKQQREEEQEQLARDRAAAEAVELEEKEEEFHLENAKARAKQRLEDGRGEAIDMLVRDLMLGDLLDVGAEPPYSIFEGLTLAEMRDLREELEEYQGMDNKEQEHRDWWAALLVVSEAELTEAIRQDEIDRAYLRGEPRPKSAMRPREAGVHASVDEDIHTFLAGKPHSELVKLEASIQEELETGDAADPDYYAAVLRRLELHKAKARLREIHAGLLHRSLNAGTQKLDVAKEMGWGDEEDAAGSLEQSETAAADLQRGRSPSPLPAAAAPAAAAVREESDNEEAEPNTGQWSPEPLEKEHIAGRDVIPEEDDLRMLNLLRTQVQQRTAASFGAAAMAASTSGGLSEADRAYHEAVANPSRGSSHPMLRNLTDAAPQQGEATMRSGQHSEPDDTETRMFKLSANRAMGDINEAGDAPFGGEVQLESKVYWWHDKYRPRKPKYFNRVHTGYEWNKYNQTHYDHDNPPPKVVQGYKFNIFYPDLIDKSQAPEYTLEPDPEADEQGSTCLLRFHAGPPYEDLTFRILNREIEYSHKKGFKSTFDRGILALYFSFKRQRYRR